MEAMTTLGHRSGPWTRVEQVSQIIVALRREGLSVVLVEQNLQLAVAACEQVYCLVRGEVSWEGSTEQFRRNRNVAVEHLGVGATD